MLPSENDGNELYRALEDSGLLRGKRVSHDFELPALDKEGRSGYLVWRWGSVTHGEKAVLTAIYRDGDGTGVIVTVVVGTDRKLRELEAWRGDSKPIRRLPTASNLETMIPRKVYG